MIDHIGIHVSDLDRAVAFYTKALAPLGYTVLRKHGSFVGFGKNKPDFWITAGEAVQNKVHVAFTTSSRKVVREFYDAAIAAGGKDNGAPGVRAMYHEHYFGAFVLDPDGHNIEAVCHEPYLE